MNKTAIKNFAVWARTRLRNDIRVRAGFLGINENGIATPLPASTQEIKYFEVGSAQPIALSGEDLRNREKIAQNLSKKAKETDYKTAYDLMIETYASDWFNRFIAIRFMEVNERFSDNMRVLSSSQPDRHDPDIVSMPFSSDIEFTDAERSQITEWKTKNETDKLFRFLLIKRCNELSEVLPGLFEKKGDESELMMYQSFIDKDGLIYHLVNDIDEEDWKDQVQIIGWIYQYYNSELKDETFALAKKGKKISKERIPSATQLFTPDWIVRYMVENSLGRLWVEGHTSGEWSEETEKKAAESFGWKYYLPEAKQEPEVAEQLKRIRDEYSKLNPEDLTFIDPSMGSGHILVYAFDVLMQIYESLGYTDRDAVRSIVENNIYGLDIDDRAYQLAYFAVMMKACEYDGRFLTRGVKPHVYSIQESNDINRNQLKYFGAGLSDIEKNNAMNQVVGLLDTYIDAKEYGSILNVEKYDWDLLTRFAESTVDQGQMNIETIGIDETQRKLQRLIEISSVMAKKYWVACTNPPYMSISGGDDKLNYYAKKYYPNSKTDFFAIFIERANTFINRYGFAALVTQYVWTYKTIYSSFRADMLEKQIISMTYLGPGAFPEISGEIVDTVAFVMQNKALDEYKSVFKKLRDCPSADDKVLGFLSGHNQYITKQKLFTEVAEYIYAYWVSDTVFETLRNAPSLENMAYAKKGLTTGDNTLFTRLWYEVDMSKLAINESAKWVPMTKGGDFRKWYGNNDYVINWENEGFALRSFKDKDGKLKSVLRNTQFYFREGISWNDTGSGDLTFRYQSERFIPNASGPCVYSGQVDIRYLIGLFNSKVSRKFMEVLAPALKFEVGSVAKYPIIYNVEKNLQVVKISEDSIKNAQADWDFMETSWDFKRHPLVLSVYDKKEYKISQFASQRMEKFGKVSWHFEKWQEECDERFNTLKANEEELNRIFIDVYGLQDELTPEEEDSDVTVRRADLTRDIKSLVSYAVGCMLGRYSLDVDGLAYAGGDWDASKYTTFQPDADNVIPITDARYMDDDIVDRFCEWLTVVYGADTLEENLDFIAKALGTKGTDSRDIIRNYFLNDFFKDHCQTYSVTGSGKRPIYWLFDSGKQNGFKALIYMHRYNADTIGRVRVSYLHPLQEKYENEVRSIDTMIDHMSDQRQIASEEKRREKLIKQIAEVKEYDERLDHLAQEHIDIDLDDGVKVNYEKIQTDRDGKVYQILAPIK